MAVSLPTTVCTYQSAAAVTTSGAQAVTAAVPLGSLLIVSAAGAASGVTFGASDTGGNTWTALFVVSQATGTLMSAGVLYTKITTALTTSDTITVTRNSSNSMTFAAEYVTGQHPTSPIGNSGVTQGNSSSTSVNTLSTAAVSANAGDMTRTVWVVNGNSTSPTSTIVTVTNNMVSTVTATRRMATGYRIAATSESPTPDMSWTTANATALGSYVIAVAPSSDPWIYNKIASFGS